MCEPNLYQDWILETIDSLRSRKARPDLERICRMVRRRHGSDPDRTRTELEKLIQSKTVLKVSYKGSISYRNAAKVLKKSRKKTELVASSGESSKQEHLNSDSAHSFTDPDQEDASVGPREHELQSDSALSSGCDRAATRCAAPPDEKRASGSSTISGFGQKQEGCRQPSRVGHTSRTHSGNLAPRKEDESCGLNCLNNTTCNLPPQRQTPSLKTKLYTANSAPATTGHMEPHGLKDILGYLSTEERLCVQKLSRGKVTVVMDKEVARGRLRWTRCGNVTLSRRGAALEEPSDWGKPLQVLFPLHQDNDPTTSEGCQQMEEENPQSYEEDAKGCPVAMTTEPEAKDAVIQMASKQRWAKAESCPDSPSIKFCPPDSSCAAVLKQSHGDLEIDRASCLLTPTASPAESVLSDEPGTLSAGSLSSEGLSPVDWTVSDVVSYFTAAGFPEQAVAFRTQEIDGKSLLLMQRNDVLTGLSIKLGPALKIYEHHVKALQKTHFEDDELI